MQRDLLSAPARSLSRPVGLAAFVSLALATSLHGADSPKPQAGEVRLASGRIAEYTIHFDRNSLRDSVRVGDGLIALTSSGTLLRFAPELPAVRWARERIGLEEVTCLGRGEGDAVLAGLSDGRVCRVDPVTLDLTEVAKLPAPPQWIGWGQGQAQAPAKRPAGLVVVTRPTRPFRSGGILWDKPSTAVHDLATGKSYALEDETTVFLLDRAGRVWLGFDKGEWGGQITRVDLIRGTVETIQPPPSRDPDFDAAWEGVYGFIELRDGQVWAYGGTSHMGSNTGEITRIDEAKPRTLSAFEPDRKQDQEQNLDPGLPRMPITHIVEENDGLVVLSYSDVFRVDKALKTWKNVATLDLTYRWGRPNAVGSYPSVCGLHPPQRAGEPYLLTTVGDGVVVLDGKKATSHAIRGQLGAASVDGVVNSSEGAAVLRR